MEYQGYLNNAKDRIIARINADYGLKLDAAEYLFVIRQRGCLGKAWDAIWNKVAGKELDKDYMQVILIRVHPPATTEGDKP